MSEDRAAEDVTAHLERAIASGHTVAIVYHGGSQPGTKRPVTPREIRGALLLADDLANGEPRHFRLDKLEIVTPEHPAPRYVPAPPSERPPRPPRRTDDDEIVFTIDLRPALREIEQALASGREPTASWLSRIARRAGLWWGRRP